MSPLMAVLLLIPLESCPESLLVFAPFFEFLLSGLTAVPLELLLAYLLLLIMPGIFFVGIPRTVGGFLVLDLLGSLVGLLKLVHLFITGLFFRFGMSRANATLAGALVLALSTLLQTTAKSFRGTLLMRFLRPSSRMSLFRAGI